MTEREKVIKAFEFCLMPSSREELENDICSHEDCPYYREYNGGKCISAAASDALALLKAQESMKKNGEQYQCNKCKYYEGVHNIAGHAPCSFWNIGGVMWNDYCSRFHDFRIGGEVG